MFDEDSPIIGRFFSVDGRISSKTETDNSKVILKPSFAGLTDEGGGQVEDQQEEEGYDETDHIKKRFPDHCDLKQKSITHKTCL